MSGEQQARESGHPKGMVPHEVARRLCLGVLVATAIALVCVGFATYNNAATWVWRDNRPVVQDSFDPLRQYELLQRNAGGTLEEFGLSFERGRVLLVKAYSISSCPGPINEVYRASAGRLFVLVVEDWPSRSDSLDHGRAAVYGPHRRICVTIHDALLVLALLSYPALSSTFAHFEAPA